MLRIEHQPHPFTDSARHIRPFANTDPSDRRLDIHHPKRPEILFNLDRPLYEPALIDSNELTPNTKCRFGIRKTARQFDLAPALG